MKDQPGAIVDAEILSEEPVRGPSTAEGTGDPLAHETQESGDGKKSPAADAGGGNGGSDGATEETDAIPPIPDDGTRQDVHEWDEIISRYAVNVLLVATTTLAVSILSRWLLVLVFGGFVPARDLWTKAIPFGIGFGTGIAVLCLLIAHKCIVVGANQGVVTKSLIHEKMWSFLQGFYMMYPWEDVFKTVDLTRHTKMGADEKETYLSLNDQPLKVRFLVVRKAHQYYLINYVRSDEDAADSVFKVRIKSFLTEGIRKKNDGDVISDLKKYRDDFIKVFGGSRVTDKLERFYGVWTGNPELYTIERTGLGAESRAKVIEVQSFNDAVMLHLKLTKEKGDEAYTFAQAKEDVLQVTGDATRIIHSIEGIGTLKDLPRDLRDLNINIGGLPGSQGKGKGKK
jgi:hypothetical protein